MGQELGGGGPFRKVAQLLFTLFKTFFSRGAHVFPAQGIVTRSKVDTSKLVRRFAPGFGSSESRRRSRSEQQSGQIPQTHASGPRSQTHSTEIEAFTTAAPAPARLAIDQCTGGN